MRGGLVEGKFSGKLPSVWIEMVGFKRSSKSMTIGNEPKKEKQSETNEPAKPNPPEVKAGQVGKNDDSDFEPEPPSEKETKKFK